MSEAAHDHHEEPGFISKYFFPLDHKIIAMQYLFTGMAMALIGGFFHQLHHRYYECNYGSPEFLLDKWFGTYNDGTEKMTMKIRERKRRMHVK